MQSGGYIGYTGASSTAVSVVTDIAEGLDVSGFTPHITVSSMPGLCADISGCTVPVSGIQLADIKTKLDGISDDILATSAVSVAQDGIGVSGLVLDNIKTGTDFLSGIDSDTDSIKTNTGYVRADLGSLSGVEASGFAVANATLITMDGVLDDILSDTALIVEDNDDIRLATEATLVVNTSGFGLANASLNTIGTYLNDVEGSLAAIELNGDHMEVLNASGFTINTSGHGYANARLNSVATNVDKIINEQEKVDVSVSGWDPTVIGRVMLALTAPGGGTVYAQGDDDGNLMLNASASPPTEITSPVLPADSEFLSTATFTFDAGGDIPASDVEVIAAQGVSKRILIYGVTISSTGTSGRGYWYLHDGAFVNDGSPYNKCSGAIDAGNGVAVTNLAFPYPIAIRANYAVNISVTEAVSQAYLVGTVYYKVADYS